MSIQPNPKLCHKQMKLITVEGNIGVGKTTFLKQLEGVPNIKVMYEPVDDWLKFKGDDGISLFEMFYNDRKRYSFTFQMMALQTRFENLVKICNEYKNNDNTENIVVVCERSIFTDYNVFAKTTNAQGDMSDVELQVYKQCHQFMTSLCDISIDKYIYLKASPEVCLERIKQRNREGEENITIDYLRRLDECHDKWLDEITSDNMLKVNTEVPLLINNITEFIKRKD